MLLFFDNLKRRVYVLQVGALARLRRPRLLHRLDHNDGVSLVVRAKMGAHHRAVVRLLVMAVRTSGVYHLPALAESGF